jgi:hypothetical protein
MRVLFITLVAGAFLFGAEPKFGDYPAVVYKGKIAKSVVALFGKDFRIDFAGKYCLNTYACFDGDCDNAVIIDVESGEAQPLTGVISYKYIIYPNHAGYRFMVKPNSSLFELSYLESDEYGVVDIDAPYRKIYFTFKDGEFAEIAKVEFYPDDFMAFLENYNKCEDLDGYDVYNNVFQGREMSEEDKQWEANYEKYCAPIEEDSKKLLAKYKKNKKIAYQIKILMER